MSEARGRTLGVVVPCRDEARTIARKLENLARASWPASEREHVIVVVDDGSADGTSELARAAIERCFAGGPGSPSVSGGRVRARVVANGIRPGKSGAIEQALRELEGRVDLVVLTDADVVLDPEALVRLERAFEDDRLALACGAQRFVRSLAPDGSLCAADGGKLTPADAAFDRWTARVRRLESRWGRLVSVHGQLLAWRAIPRLAPTPGIAADDLDLCLQVRERRTEPRRVELVRGALFYEVKTPPGPAQRSQTARRARAWFQAVRRPYDQQRGAPYLGTFEHMQWLCYRYLPGWAPRLTWLVPLVTILGAGALFDRSIAMVLTLAWLLVLSSPPGWRWLKLATIIAAAGRDEAARPLSDRWETPRA